MITMMMLFLIICIAHCSHLLSYDLFMHFCCCMFAADPDCWRIVSFFTFSLYFFITHIYLQPTAHMFGRLLASFLPPVCINQLSCSDMALYYLCFGWMRALSAQTDIDPYCEGRCCVLSSTESWLLLINELIIIADSADGWFRIDE